MKMYEVCAKFGHVGRNYYIDKTVAVKATSAKEAAYIVRNMPRVKHDHKDAIRYVNQIDIDKYRSILRDNREDPYMHCSNIQEQRRMCNLEKVHEANSVYCKKREQGRQKCYHHKLELKNPKRYVLNYISYEEYMS